MEPGTVLNERHERIMELLANDRAKTKSTRPQDLAYRSYAEAAIGKEENLYRIEWVSPTPALWVRNTDNNILLATTVERFDVPTPRP